MTQTRKFILKTVRIVVGSVLLIVGLSGLVLPVIPGWLLIIPGVVILARDIHLFRRLICWTLGTRFVQWVERRWPRTREPLERIRERMRRHHEEHARPAFPVEKSSDDKKREVA